MNFIHPFCDGLWTVFFFLGGGGGALKMRWSRCKHLEQKEGTSIYFLADLGSGLLYKAELLF